MNWLKENWFKLLIGLALVFVSAGYMVSQLTNRNVEQSNISMKEKCFKIGSAVHNNISDEYKDAGRNYSLLRAEFIYNKNLNTCLYSSGSITNNIVQKWVYDSFTNEEILSFTSVDGKPFGSISIEEYNKKKIGII